MKEGRIAVVENSSIPTNRLKMTPPTKFPSLNRARGKNGFFAVAICTMNMKSPRPHRIA